MADYIPQILIILDGWGYSETSEYNAINTAHKPNWDQLWAQYPHTLISGSGTDVGLPAGQMGNSEVGHLTMGAGRLVPQDYTRIDQAIADKSFFTHPIFNEALNKAKHNDKAVHILGLLSPGGVHSHEGQIQAMVELAASKGINKLYLHVFLDGRDMPPQSALASIQALESKCSSLGVGKIVSLIGRYYAMDRDQRWERTQAAYNLLTQGRADYQAANAELGLAQAYARGESDEFVKPTIIQSVKQTPVKINDGDVVIFMNFRADRARQLSQAFVEPDFTGFTRSAVPQLNAFISLTQYSKTLSTTTAYPPINMQNCLAEIIANQGWRQLRIAETEKYAHVTFFFSGTRELPFTGEDRILLASPKVATYDLQPEMSAVELTTELVKAIKSQPYALIVCNFANPDMVGHTGNFTATVKAIETIDQCLGQIIKAAQQTNHEVIITADHGNAECMFDERTQQAHTAHTSDPVPLLYIGRPAQFIVNNGTLADIAPTILHLLNLEVPAEMSGRCLLKLINTTK